MKSKKKKLKKLNILVILLVIGLLGYLGYQIYDKNFSDNKNDSKSSAKTEEELEEEENTPKLQILNLNSNTRSIGVMIDNEPGAWPQAGLQKAYLVYEIIVEGGQTRLFAIFKDQDAVVVGPNRSARHYYIDYTLENDAIFTHFGFSDQAKADIKSLRINDISGTEADGSIFWRVAPKSSYHNVFTNTTKIMERAKAKKYRTTTTTSPLLSYSIDAIDLSTNASAKVANNVTIRYSKYHSVGYEYDSINQVYKRSMRGLIHYDRTTNKQYTVKNIITYQVKNYDLNDGSGKGRQGLTNIGSGTGSYISNGYSIPITWSKSSRAAKTIYKDTLGNVLKVNDGNTFIQIQPTGQTLTIE
ncbi:MAG: DUF3048 domain-containing protein [Bacilli bacterium]|nr:DUF3048 domain-containing protein [Bacilli bacterium]